MIQEQTLTNLATFYAGYSLAWMLHDLTGQDFKRVLIYGGEDEFIHEDTRESCNQLKVINLLHVLHSHRKASPTYIVHPAAMTLHRTASLFTISISDF